MCRLSKLIYFLGVYDMLHNVFVILFLKFVVCIVFLISYNKIKLGNDISYDKPLTLITMNF